MWRTDMDTGDDIWFHILKRRSDSPGDVSCSSDTSLDFPLNFKASSWSPAHSKLRKLISDSPGGVSWSSDTSLDFPLNFKTSSGSPAHSCDDFSEFYSGMSPQDTDTDDEFELRHRSERNQSLRRPGVRYRPGHYMGFRQFPSPPRTRKMFWSHPGDIPAVLENPPHDLDILREVLKTTAEGLIALLLDGASALNGVYGALITSDADPVTGQCSNADFIRQQIVQAHQHLERSEQKAGSGLKSLDENLERLTEDEGKLEREKSSTETRLEDLRTKQASNEKLHQDTRGGLEEARRNLISTKQTLQDQKRRKRNAEIVTGVGGGLMVIPVVGWLAGIGMMIGGGVGLSQSNHAVQVAEERLRQQGDQVTRYHCEVSECESTISQTRDRMRQKERELEQMCERFQRLRKQREMMVESQEEMRRVLHLLGLLSRESSMAEHQTRRFILQEPVAKVMRDVMRVTERIRQDELVDSDMWI